MGSTRALVAECKQCGARLSVKTRLTEKIVHCPKCNAPVAVSRATTPSQFEVRPREIIGIRAKRRARSKPLAWVICAVAAAIALGLGFWLYLDGFAEQREKERRLH